MPPKRRKLSRIPKLTRREHAVLKLIWSGLDTKAIGDKLKISPKTVHVYRGNLLRKLRASNPIELLRAALVAKLLKA